MPSPDHDRDSVERRLDAVERALADDQPLENVDRVDDLEGRVAELEAAVQALRGYVGSIRAVNEDVERRADRALRKVAALERHVGPAGGDPGDSLPTTDGDRSDPDDGPHAVGRGTGSDPPAESTLDRLRRWL